VRGCLLAVSRALAFALAGAFALGLPLALAAFNLGRVAFSAPRMTALVTATITEAGGLQRVVIEALAAESAATEGEDGLSLAGALQFLTPAEREYISDRLTPEGWPEAQVASVVEGLYAWLENDRARPEFVIDIAPLKIELLSGVAAELVETVVDSWPPCSLEQVATMSLEALFAGGDIILCEPPEPIRSGLVGLLNVSVTTSLRALPDRMSLGEGDPDTPASAQVLRTKERVRRVRDIAGWSWLAAPALLAAVGILVVRSWRDAARWWGIPLLVGGLLALGAALALRGFAAGGLRSALAESDLPTWMAAMLSSLLAAIVAVASRQVFVQAAWIALAGLVLLFVASRLAPRSMPEAVGRSMAATLPLPADAGRPSAEDDEPPVEGERPSGMFG